MRTYCRSVGTRYSDESKRDEFVKKRDKFVVIGSVPRGSQGTYVFIEYYSIPGYSIHLYEYSHNLAGPSKGRNVLYVFV